MVFYGEKVDQSIAQEGYPKDRTKTNKTYPKWFLGVKPACGACEYGSLNSISSLVNKVFGKPVQLLNS